jgi:cell division protein FtsW
MSGTTARPPSSQVARDGARSRGNNGAKVSRETAGASTMTLKQAAPLSYHLVWITALLLLTVGMCMVLSVSTADVVRGEDMFSYVRRQGIAALIGLALMFGVSHLDYRKLRSLSKWFLGFVALSLLAVHIPGVGHRVNGAWSYIALGPLSYQPSEFAKLAVVLAGAHFLSTARVRHGGFRSYMLPFGIAGFSLCGLVVWENDFGTATIITGLLLGMLWLAGMKSKQWLLLTGGGALFGAGLMFAIAGGKVIARITAVLNPGADPDGTGYQVRQSLLALGRGGWFGVGPGRSVQKFDYLPEAHNDMIYAIFGEEFGFVGAGLLIILFVVFAVACWRLAKQCADPMGKYVVAGCGMIVTLQAGINIGGVIGAIPLTGVPLPFVSYGCNSLIVMLTAVGLILAVARRASARTAPSPATRYRDVEHIDSGRWDGRARGARSSAG